MTQLNYKKRFLINHPFHIY